jgi:primary-amine oxidase
VEVKKAEQQNDLTSATGPRPTLPQPERSGFCSTFVIALSLLVGQSALGQKSTSHPEANGRRAVSEEPVRSNDQIPPLPSSPSLVQVREKAEHPLDPLTAIEYSILKSIVEQHSNRFGDGLVYASALLKEPSKTEVKNFNPGESFSRQAVVSFLSPKRATSYEAIVDIRERTLISSRQLVKHQPPFTEYDFVTALEVVNSSPLVRSVLESRGYDLDGKTPLDVLQIAAGAPGEDPWISSLRVNGRRTRVVRVLFEDNKGVPLASGPTLDGLEALVDIYHRKIVKLVNKPTPKFRNGNRFSISPSDSGTRNNSSVDQKAVPSIDELKISGNQIQWHDWRFRVSFNSREGLVLHQIGFLYGGRLRSICYRASLSELLVPYADGSWREFLDAGEYGLGSSSTSLRPGVELPANSITLPVTLANSQLEPLTMDKRIFFYERESGLLLFHKMENEMGEARVSYRAKELVTGFMVTLGNYDYLVEWVLRRDGSFGVRATLLGYVLTKAAETTRCQACLAQTTRGPGIYRPSGDQRFGPLVAAQRVGVLHQHWFNFRLDWDLDGSSNAVKEQKIIRYDRNRLENPLDRAFGVQTEVFSKETNAKRRLADGRSWVIFNPSNPSILGHYPGYAINVHPSPESWIAKRRQNEGQSFSQHDVWFTRFNEAELYASGRYPMQSPNSDREGLAAYAANRESIYEEDVVSWINVGINHIPKSEEFPIMPAQEIGLDFKPAGFFSRTPALKGALIELPHRK